MNSVWLGRCAAVHAVVGSAEEVSLRMSLERQNPCLLSDLASGLHRPNQLPVFKVGSWNLAYLEHLFPATLPPFFSVGELSLLL